MSSQSLPVSLPELTLHDVMSAIHSIQATLGRVETKLIEHDERFDTLTETVEFIKETAVTKDEFEERFAKTDQRFDKMDQRFIQMDTRFDKMDQRFNKMDQSMGGLETHVVTKDYLDDKLANLASDLLVVSRKSNKKLEMVVEELVSKHQLTRTVADRILAMEPFAR